VRAACRAALSSRPARLGRATYYTAGVTVSYDGDRRYRLVAVPGAHAPAIEKYPWLS